MSSATPIELTSFLWDSTPFLLAYSLPLLLLSILLALSGTFLTLDRTRTFAPRSDVASSIPGAYDDIKQNPSFIRSFLALRWVRLDGGIGGAAAGYVFGLQLATFLALLISNNTSSHTLTPTTFLVIWVFSVIPTTILGGRWKPFALLFIGMSGGISLSLGLSVLTHPSLPARVVLSSVMTPLVTILVLLPLVVQPLQEHFQHPMTRFATSCIGAFSVTMAIAIFTRSTSSSSWANAWDRLWVANGVGWENARERGFDVLFCVLWAAGAGSDWALKRWIGQDPDEKWDSYLADYTSTLPNLNDRAGNFQPLKSWWTRVMAKVHLSGDTNSDSVAPLDIIFPSDAELALKAPYGQIPGGLHPEDEKRRDTLYMSKDELQSTVTPLAYNWTSDSGDKLEGGGILKKVRTTKGRGRGFTTVYSSDAEDTDYLTGDELPGVHRRPTFLKKRKERKVDSKGTRRPVKFRPHSGSLTSSDEDSSDEDTLATPTSTPAKGVRIRTTPVRSDSVATSMSGTTMVLPSATPSHEGDHQHHLVIDVEKEKARLAGLRNSFGAPGGGRQRSRSPGTPIGAPDYSDVEEIDVTNALDYLPNRPEINNNGAENWTPTFMKRASEGQTDGNAVPPGAVPMTPSLMNALNRIAAAQAHAYGPDASLPTKKPEHISIPMDSAPVPLSAPGIPGLPIVKDQRLFVPDRDAAVGGQQGATDIGGMVPAWDSFWQEVLAKANVPERDLSPRS
ncbi:hypothetical protein SCHPADRAFT_846773 [Schizopora paradoxa]|uniref:TM7S3/TM198-like domain-containing protein n=1 Tax=Schizopora paradoxa TaxID=27342 RepID=A0A0H2RZY0_9AGAM|nr:hypothetical protein SCHPADRAFT_846773 [Schizopora paradoxa]